MRRRKFITLLGGAATWPLVARAQQPERMRRIGLLMPAGANDLEFQARVRVFREALQQLGWTEGVNVRIDARWATSNADIVKEATELARLGEDVIVAYGTSTVVPLVQATRTVPIVFPIMVDPVGAGVVESLARPGGNATGFMVFEYGMAGKWLDLLKAGRAPSEPNSGHSRSRHHRRHWSVWRTPNSRADIWRRSNPH